MTLSLGVGVVQAAFSATSDSASNSLVAAAAFPAYQSQILADSPLLAWRMDNTPGSTTSTDASLNAATGTHAPSTTTPVLKGQAGAPAGNGNAGIRIPGPTSAAPSYTATSTTSTRSHLTASADFDNDGFMDVATTIFSLGQVEVRFGQAAGGWAATVTLTGGTTPHDIAAGDLNGDGTADLAWGDTSSAKLLTATSNGNRTFSAVTTTTTTFAVHGVATGDVDADGKDDIAVTYNTGNANVTVYRFAPGYANPTSYATTGTGARNVRLADVNGDQKPDLVYIIDSTARLGVRLNNGSGGFNAEVVSVIPASPSHLDVGDLDADGDVDVVVAASGSAASAFAVSLNNGSGTFPAATGYAASVAMGAVVIADVDGDQRPDVNVTGGTVAVSFLGNGAGAFTASTSTTVASGAGIGAGDFDGDGDPDLVVATNASNTLVYLRNGTTRRVTPYTGGASTVTPVAQTAAFTAEIWFRTTTTTGGKLFGFGNHVTGDSANYDRHLYMLDSGKLTFGVFNSASQTAGSTKAYNDGRWHQAVVSLGAAQMKLYVDGAIVGTNTFTTSNNPYPSGGFWRIGGDTLVGWPGVPTSKAFAGSLDDFSVFPTQLTDARITAHYAARTGTTYASTVTSDTPSVFWRLADTGTDGVIADASGNGVTGRFTAPITLSWPGALGGTGASAGAAQYNGGGHTYLNGAAIPGPNLFSFELWFRTTTNQGGKLLGFGNGTAGNSTAFDRHLYMANDGRLFTGTNGAPSAIVNSTASYNDGAWHHAAVTLATGSGLRLYVDGELVASNAAATSGESYSGYWRVGGDGLSSWPSRPTSDYFRGAIDEASVYGKALTPAQVRGHFRARNRTG